MITSGIERGWDMCCCDCRRHQSIKSALENLGINYFIEAKRLFGSGFGLAEAHALLASSSAGQSTAGHPGAGPVITFCRKIRSRKSRASGPGEACGTKALGSREAMRP